MLKVETSYIEHDMVGEMQYQMQAVPGLKVTGTEFADLDDELFGLFYSSNDDVLVTFEFDESIVKEAFHILSRCEECNSGLYNYNPVTVANCAVEQAVIDEWLKMRSVTWSEFKKSAGYEKLRGMSQDEQWDFSDENHFTALI